MLRSVELELRTVSEANAREFWRARAGRRSDQRDVVRAALNDQFGAAPLFHVVVNSWTRDNPIDVTLTRMAPGELDEGDNLPGSMKAVRDEIAAWFGVDDRDKRLRWKYAQERTAAGIYKLRIDIADATPGEDKIVQLASAAEAAGSRLRPLVKVKRGEKGQAVIALVKSFAAVPWEQPACEECARPCSCSRRGEGLERPCMTAFRLSRSEGADGGKCACFCHRPCTACKGRGTRYRLAHLARYDTLDNPPSTIDVRVPAEHLGRWPAATVKLHRRQFQTKATGVCWLYEERQIK